MKSETVTINMTSDPGPTVEGGGVHRLAYRLGLLTSVDQMPKKMRYVRTIECGNLIPHLSLRDGEWAVFHGDYWHVYKKAYHRHV